MKITLVILTYNEIVGLRQLFKLLPLDKVDECFVVDGGSTDGTLDFFEQNKTLVYLQKIKGRGEAFRIAFEKAQGDALIFFSPDGNEDPADVPKFKPFLENNYDMVIANRMGKNCHNEEDENFFKWRKWANNFFTLIANITWNKGPYVQDTINGYRAISKKAWAEIQPDGHNYTIEYQSSIRCFKKKLKIAEFPTREDKRIDNRIGSPSLKTGISFLKLYWKELFG
jgi:glycosyltransferase involved in cell wall biosynthesis